MWFPWLLRVFFSLVPFLRFGSALRRQGELQEVRSSKGELQRQLVAALKTATALKAMSRAKAQ